MVTPGGEVAFVSRMITESLELRDRVQWYSSMLGKLSSVPIIIEQLRKAPIENYAVTEFVQGSKTRRWAIAWSFGDLRPKMAVARGVTSGGLPKHFLPFPGEYIIHLSDNASNSRDEIASRLNDALSSLPFQWRWKSALSTGVGFAPRNVWSRYARRKSARVIQIQEHEEEVEDEDEDEMAFGFKITVEVIDENEQEKKGINVSVRWLKGSDSALFESFCGMIKRKLDG